MKPEEAIKSMYNLNMVLSITDSERESVNMAIAALEKQIPKKPEKKKELVFCDLDNGRHESGKKDVFCCPTCGESVGMKYGEHPIVNVQNYCKKCGQRIDWKDER